MATFFGEVLPITSRAFEDDDDEEEDETFIGRFIFQICLFNQCNFPIITSFPFEKTRIII